MQPLHGTQLLYFSQANVVISTPRDIAGKQMVGGFLPLSQNEPGEWDCHGKQCANSYPLCVSHQLLRVVLLFSSEKCLDSILDDFILFLENSGTEEVEP